MRGIPVASKITHKNTTNYYFAVHLSTKSRTIEEHHFLSLFLIDTYVNKTICLTYQLCSIGYRRGQNALPPARATPARTRIPQTTSLCRNRGQGASHQRFQITLLELFYCPVHLLHLLLPDQFLDIWNSHSPPTRRRRLRESIRKLPLDIVI